MRKKIYTATPNLAYCESYDDKSEKCQNCTNKSIDITSATIYQECVAFYDVYKSLEKRLESSGIHNDPSGNHIPTLLSVPYIVNGAFACELALKYVLIENQINFCYTDGHNLKYLFNLLPQRDKNNIENILKMKTNLDSILLYKEIDLIADSFIKWRYYFQNIDNGMPNTIFFHIFVNNVCSYIIE